MRSGALGGRTRLFFVLSCALLISGCAKHGNQTDEIPGKNVVTSANCSNGAPVGPFQAICQLSASGIQPTDSVAAKNFLAEVALDPSKIFTGSMNGGSASTPPAPSPSPAPSASPSPSSSPESSLILGYPVELLGEQNVFGGVITKTSDRDNETFGGLK